MDLIEKSTKEESRQHVHGWENITLAEEEKVAIVDNKLGLIFIYFYIIIA